MKHIAAPLLVLFVLGLSIPSAFGEYVPDWVKNTAGWWATDAISETEFVNAIEFLVKENIIQVNVSQVSETSQSVPDWVKNTAGWWATDAISETEFLNAIVYLIKVGIIGIESSKSPELIAEMWMDDHITDDEFLANVEQLIEKDIITIQNDSVIKTSQLPDWLVNNAGWWAARIFTNSDFNFDYGYIKEKIYPCVELSTNTECFTIKINSYSFRGNEFQEQKHDIDFRIFAVGGSSTLGSGATDDETWPAHLQQIINEKITGKKIEVINSGLGGATVVEEYNLIKNKISSLDPDLIIMFDGWNDFEDIPIEKTIQNWESVCKLGKNEGFDTIIIVQPLAISGQRVPTEQEISNGVGNFAYLQTSQQYVDAFEKLDKVCTKTADFRTIFDYVQEPIFYDHGHTMSFGNKIIAENIFSVISPIYFAQTYSVIHSDLQIENNEPETGGVYAVGADLSYKNFDNLNLQNAVFDKADLSNTSFKNANINGARFILTNLSHADLSDQNITEIILTGADLSNTNLTNTILTGADLSYVILTSVDLSGKDLTGTILKGIDLSHSNLSGVNLAGMDLLGAKLVGVDLSGKDLTGTQLSHTNLTDANLENTKLTTANLINVDFTEIKNKSLAGADLFNTSFAHSTLTGVNLSNVIINNTNFWNADLSGLDFTVIFGPSLKGSEFIEANLSNSNFEGVNLGPETEFFDVFKNKAFLMRKFSSHGTIPNSDLVENLFGKEYINTRLILFTEVRGNDLAVKWIDLNNFGRANLENVNFKNAILWHVEFHSANLTNADLSGADLKGTDFGKADLSNANLSGADLTEANLSGADLSGADLFGADLTGALVNEGTILACKNHPICQVP